MRIRVKSLVCLALTLAAVCSLALVRDTAAWFNTQTGTALGQTITVKKVNFDFLGTIGSYYTENPSNANADKFIITGQNLILDNNGKITGKNYSSIQTELRFRITYTSPLAGTQKVYTANTSYAQYSDELTATVDSNWAEDSQAPDGWFYRTLAIGSDLGTSFDIINRIEFDDDAFSDSVHSSNLYGGTVTVTIQARQSDNVDWTDIWSS